MNIGLVSALLDINRFMGIGDLREAESALMENIQIQWLVKESSFYLAVVSARKGLLQEAQDRLAETAQADTQQLTKHEESYRLQAEIELARSGGSWYEAVTACQELIEIYKRGEYHWEWARQLIDLGDVLLGRDEPGDHERAEEAYRQSLEMFTEMGALGYIRVLEDRLRGM
jgi:tetratricopeptide (TPR) repeat protein